jgi:hypothetical protein
VVNAGTIAGNTTDDAGIDFLTAGSVTNQSGGAITGFDGIFVAYAAVTGVNAGTITGSSYTVKFAAGYANRPIADPGAVFTGNVDGGGCVLELASTASAGTLAGLGTGITNFSALQFDAGAAWTVSGNDSASGLGTIAITGFANGGAQPGRVRRACRRASCGTRCMRSISISVAKPHGWSTMPNGTCR